MRFRLVLVLVCGIAAAFSSSAKAYGGDGKMGVYQIGVSFKLRQPNAVG